MRGDDGSAPGGGFGLAPELSDPAAMMNSCPDRDVWRSGSQSQSSVEVLFGGAKWSWPVSAMRLMQDCEIVAVSIARLCDGGAVGGGLRPGRWAASQAMLTRSPRWRARGLPEFRAAPGAACGGADVVVGPSQ